MIHGYELNGYHIIIDPPSGSIHQVDSVAFDTIMNYEEKDSRELKKMVLEKHKNDVSLNGNELDELFQDIEELITTGKLFSKEETWEELSEALWGRAAGSQASPQLVKALCLHVAHTCNMTCDYCFASQGKYQGERGLMSLEVGRKAIDFLLSSSGSVHNLEVDFFGGEPLMNWGMVKNLVAYARGQEERWNKKFRFTLTTNGLLLDEEVMDFCNREMHNVVLSLDGRKEIHDRLRRTTDGEDSYNRIVPLFQQFCQKRGDKEHYIRGTFTRENLDFTQDIYHMTKLGFDKLSMEPVVCNPKEAYALKEEDLPFLKKQYEELAIEMVARSRKGEGFTFYHYMLDLEGGPCIYKRLAGCGSGTEYMAVTPWGDLYPCHQFVGDEKFLMGNVWEGVTHPEISEQFAISPLATQEKCRTCWARLYCSGGCAANSYHTTGDLQGIYDLGCELFKKRLECAIMIQVALG
jgi:uncharacterized protein